MDAAGYKSGVTHIARRTLASCLISTRWRGVKRSCSLEHMKASVFVFANARGGKRKLRFTSTKL